MRLEIHSLIQELRDDQRSIVLTTHYIEEAERLCDRVAIIDSGKIIAHGTPAELMAKTLGGSIVELMLEAPLPPGDLPASIGADRIDISADRLTIKATARKPARLMAELGVSLGDLEVRADALRKDGATALFVAVDGHAGGVIAIADPIKATTRAAIDDLKASGIHIVMLTGDNKTTAEAVAKALGIDDVHADVLPDFWFPPFIGPRREVFSMP